jgi:hypothetical protein
MAFMIRCVSVGLRLARPRSAGPWRVVTFQCGADGRAPFSVPQADRRRALGHGRQAGGAPPRPPGRRSSARGDGALGHQRDHLPGLQRLGRAGGSSPLACSTDASHRLGQLPDNGHRTPPSCEEAAWPLRR